MANPANTEHVAHVALREAKQPLAELVKGTTVQDAVASIGALFIVGFEFGLRFAQSHPDAIESTLHWLATEVNSPDAPPQEMIERDMADDIRRMFSACDDDDPL